MKPLPIFLPVVHVLDPDQTFNEVDVALSNGASGFFLIAHKLPFHHLTEIFNKVRNLHPTAWMGVNYLDLRADAAVRMVAHLNDCDGLWVDSIGCKEPDMTPMRLSGLARYCFAGDKWRFFAGTLFKYQRDEADPDAVVRRNSELFDVVCTSGPETGVAPDIEKIKQMRRHLDDDTPLAVASGISAENVRPLIDYVDTFMVASSLEVEHGKFDPAKVAELARILNEHPTA